MPIAKRREVLSMAADLAGGPCTPVAGMYTGSWQGHGQAITVAAGSTHSLSNGHIHAGNHLPAAALHRS